MSTSKYLSPIKYVFELLISQRWVFGFEYYATLPYMFNVIITDLHYFLTFPEKVNFKYLIRKDPTNFVVQGSTRF